MKKWLRNLKISFKITLGFLVVAAIAGIVGIMGFSGISNVGNTYAIVYEDTVAALECVTDISSSFEAMRKNLYRVALVDTKADKEATIANMKEQHDIIKQNIVKYNTMLERYKGTDVASIKIIKQLETDFDLFYQGAQSYINSPAAMDNNRRKEAIAILSPEGDLYEKATLVNVSITDLFNFNKDYASSSLITNQRLITNTGLLLICIVLVGIVFAILIGLWISNSISKPINQIVDVATKLSNGDFNINIDWDSKDETGILAQTFKHMSNNLTAIVEDLKYSLDGMANGDFTIESKIPELYTGDFAPLTQSMYKMISSISETITQINTAADQVSTGSYQVSSGAQSLAAGSTQQAASIQELSASIEKIAEQIKENSSVVNASALYVQQTRVDVAEGNTHMDQLTNAMEDIRQASNQIANITEAIEGIAFQTNILALNAAIEAARAGNAGKGFAVVADEVRALAEKSADAAKKTVELIDASIQVVAKGTEITEQTAQILHRVGVSSSSVVDSFERIEKSSSEQSISIENVKEGISQISAIVQTNAANAEENSATSEEMSAQAVSLRNEVEKFKLLKNFANI